MSPKAMAIPADYKKNPIWEFFLRQEVEGKTVVVCLACKQNVSNKVSRMRAHFGRCPFRVSLQGGARLVGEELPGAGGVMNLEALKNGDAAVYDFQPSCDVSHYQSSKSPSKPVKGLSGGLLWDNITTSDQDTVPNLEKDWSHSPSMANQQYCLKWNNHQSNLLRAFDRLLQSESFTDVTLACEGRSLRAHKVVLSACSSYFEQLFEEHPDKSPIIILKDMKFMHVSQLVNFMYRGEINITQDMLSGLLHTAETLKVKGLAEVSGEQPSLPSSLIAPNFRMSNIPQMLAGNSPLATALNAPLAAPPLAPLSALLNSEVHVDEHRANLLKRLNHEVDNMAAAANGGSHEPSPSKMSRLDEDSDSSSNPLSCFMSDGGKGGGGSIGGSSPVTANILTPLPNELSVNTQQEIPEFLRTFNIYRLNDYLGFRTRQQFWEEAAVRRILEGIKNKEIDMKSAAELLGVSYGTLYGRYREVFGYLKHSWVNKPGRSSTSAGGQKEKSVWEEPRAQELIQQVLNKELSPTAAAVRLGVDTSTFFAHLTEGGKNKARVSLLMGEDEELPTGEEDDEVGRMMAEIRAAGDDKEDEEEEKEGDEEEQMQMNGKEGDESQIDCKDELENRDEEDEEDEFVSEEPME